MRFNLSRREIQQTFRSGPAFRGHGPRSHEPGHRVSDVWAPAGGEGTKRDKRGQKRTSGRIFTASPRPVPHGSPAHAPSTGPRAGSCRLACSEGLCGRHRRAVTAGRRGRRSDGGRQASGRASGQARRLRRRTSSSLGSWRTDSRGRSSARGAPGSGTRAFWFIRRRGRSCGRRPDSRARPARPAPVRLRADPAPSGVRAARPPARPAC